MASSSSASAVSAFLGNSKSNGIIHTRRTCFNCPLLLSSVNAKRKFSLYSSSSNSKKSNVVSAKKQEQQALEYKKVGDSDLVISEITLGTELEYNNHILLFSTIKLGCFAILYQNCWALIRASQNKVDHASGSIPFAYRAKKRKEEGDRAPIPNAWADAYEKNAPDKAAAMREAAKASIASFEASNSTPPPVEDGSDSTPPTPIVLPLQTQIDILQGEVGVRRGTTIRSMGSGFRRDPRTRGSAQPAGAIDGDLRSTVEQLREDNEGLRRRMAEQEEEIKHRLSTQAEQLAREQEARLQQQRVVEDMQRQLFELFRRDASGGSSISNQQPPQS